MSTLKGEARLKDILRRNPVRHRSILYWSLLNLVDPRETVVLVDAANSFVEYLARETTSCPVVRTFSLSACEKHGTWIESLLEGGISREERVPVYPVVLGERGCTLEYQFYRTLNAASEPVVSKIKQETLDVAFSGLSAISLVYINDAMRLMEILAGGVDVVKNQRPVIAVSGIALAEQSDLLVWCGANDYSPMDSCMQPYQQLSGEESSLDDVILFPVSNQSLSKACKKAIFYGVFDGLGVLGDKPVVLPSEVLVEDINFTLVDSFGVETGVIEPFLYGKELSVPLRDVLVKNWYDFESDGEQVWRWSGPEKDSVILLNIPAPGFYHIRLGVMNLIDDALDGTAKLYINGTRRAKAGRNAIEGGEIVADFYVSGEDFNGVAELLVCLPYTQRPSDADPRLLGLAVRSINLYWRNS